MQNFDLTLTTIDAAARTFSVAVAASPAGEVEAHEVVAPAIDLAAAVAAAPAALARLGAAFTAALLPPPLWTAWRESVGVTGSAGLRLRLRCADASAGLLPWELLYDASRASFLSRDPQTPLVRYLAGPAPRPPADAGPLRRVLAGGSSPLSLAPVNVAEELAELAQLLAEATPPPQFHTQPHLTAAMLPGLLTRHRPQIVHLSGHAVWDEATASGYWLFEGADGRADAMDAELLAGLLTGKDLRLVVLAGCDSGYTGAAAWAGLAQALVRAGAPTVVAMQGRITNQAAAAFSAAFYTALVQGEAIDSAVSLARRSVALAVRGTGFPGQWLLPVLFTRSSDSERWTAPTQPARTAPAFSSGGIQIDQVNAGIMVAGDATFNLQGTTFNVTPPADTAAVGRKLDALAAQTAELRRLLLARLDEGERRLVQQIVGALDARALEQEQRLVQALERGQLDERDLQTVLLTLQEIFVEVQRHNGLLLLLSQQVDLAAVQEALADSSVDVRHRFKVTLPLLLWFATYEGELEWGGGLSLGEAWRRLREQSGT